MKQLCGISETLFLPTSCYFRLNTSAFVHYLKINFCMIMILNENSLGLVMYYIMYMYVYCIGKMYMIWKYKSCLFILYKPNI